MRQVPSLGVGYFRWAAFLFFGRDSGSFNADLVVPNNRTDLEVAIFFAM
jgi:hypothetical protein